MATRIDVSELAKSLADVLDKVRERGETFVVERAGEPVATIGPPDFRWGLKPSEWPEHLKSLRMPDPDFAEQLAEIHASQPPMPEPRWPR